MLLWVQFEYAPDGWMGAHYAVVGTCITLCESVRA